MRANVHVLRDVGSKGHECEINRERTRFFKGSQISLNNCVGDLLFMMFERITVNRQGTVGSSNIHSANITINRLTIKSDSRNKTRSVSLQINKHVKNRITHWATFLAWADRYLTIVLKVLLMRHCRLCLQRSAGRKEPYVTICNEPSSKFRIKIHPYTNNRTLWSHYQESTWIHAARWLNQHFLEWLDRYYDQ